VQGEGRKKSTSGHYALGATEVLLDSRICSTLFNMILVNKIVIKLKLTASGWLGHPCHSQPCPGCSLGSCHPEYNGSTQVLILGT